MLAINAWTETWNGEQICERGVEFARLVNFGGGYGIDRLVGYSMLLAAAARCCSIAKRNGVGGPLASRWCVFSSSRCPTAGVETSLYSRKARHRRMIKRVSAVLTPLATARRLVAGKPLFVRQMVPEITLQYQ
jgi:hypothetical protein